jgi:Flp pilus assembly protein TadD
MKKKRITICLMCVVASLAICSTVRAEEAKEPDAKGNSVAENAFREAVADLTKAIELDPDNSDHWRRRANMYFDTKQWDKALADFSKVIELEPNQGHYWHMRGVCYLELGEPNKAIADYSKAIELEPNQDHYWHMRGLSYLRVNHLANAVVDYTKAIELNPENDHYRQQRIIAYQQLKWDESIADLKKVQDSTVSQENGKETPLKGFPKATLTIFPVTLIMTGPLDKSPEYRAWADAMMQEFRQEGPKHADILGLMLKEIGYDKFKRTNTAFQFPEGKAPRKNRAAAFGKFVSELDLKTDYALCTEVVLHIEKSFQEVYSVIVDAKGTIVWEDSQGPGDPEFDKPEDELKNCRLVCRRLIPVMGLDKLPKKELAEEKKQALREMRQTRPPEQSEFAAMDKRLGAMAGSSAGVMVYHTRVGGDHTDQSSATHLAELLNEAGLCQATVAKTGPVLKGEGWPDESTVLWLFAHAARSYVRQHPADSDYVLFVDYWDSPRTKATWAVHFVVCDRAGDWVIVDLQNSHHKDFQRINPKTLADGDRLVLERLKTYLR